jgi:hypothetical protein
MEQYFEMVEAAEKLIVCRGSDLAVDEYFTSFQGI